MCHVMYIVQYACMHACIHISSLSLHPHRSLLVVQFLFHFAVIRAVVYCKYTQLPFIKTSYSNKLTTSKVYSKVPKASIEMMVRNMNKMKCHALHTLITIYTTYIMPHCMLCLCIFVQGLVLSVNRVRKEKLGLFCQQISSKRKNDEKKLKWNMKTYDDSRNSIKTIMSGCVVAYVLFVCLLACVS